MQKSRVTHSVKASIALLVCSLLVSLPLTGQPPNWEVNTAQHQGTMTITGVIQLDGVDSRSPDDLVGVFSGAECRGVASPIYSPSLDRYFVFVSVFGGEMPDTLSFRVYQSATDSIFIGETPIVYRLNTTLGSIGDPYLFAAGNLPFVFIYEDKDGDGYFTDTDCNDEDPSVHPGAFELSGDQIDQNCNGSLIAETPQFTYFNDFAQDSDDFNNHGFSIRQEEGFDSPALHSNHPYGKQFVFDTFNLYSVLTIPIIVDEANPWIRFNEVVLVEPADEGATFPGIAFRDYVVVEARKADQTHWTPLLPAYDAKDLEEWNQTYISDIDPFSGASKATGKKTLFREQSIDMSNYFSDGDTLKIRFRLYSDYLDYGWGWAIDDLEIQNPTTAISTLSKAGVLRAYPNPFSGNQIYLHCDQPELRRPLRITLIDALGKLVWQTRHTFTKTGEQLLLHLPDLSPGYYVLQVSDGRKYSSQKIIKTK